MPHTLPREKSDFGRKVQEKAVIEKRQMALERCAAAEAGRPPATPAPPAPPVLLLQLEHGEHHDSTLYRIEKGSYLQFTPGPSLLGRKVFLYTNYVVSENDDEKGEQPEFVRNQYYGLEWRRVPDGAPDERPAAGRTDDALGAGALIIDEDLCCELRVTRAGTFHYYFVYDNAECSIGPQGSGWFQVPPTLRAGPGGRPPLPLEGVAAQTVLAKCLGPLPRWEDALRVSKECGYNLIHFTPIQELGASNSSYSIADQLRLNPAFGAGATFADVENVVSKMRTEWKMLSICDVVLNHTANESPWLSAAPEAGYNARACPHLRPAALLDALLARWSRAVARGDYAARGLPAAITHHHHLEAAAHILREEVVEAARLQELFVCDVPQLLQEFSTRARNKVPPPVKGSAEDEGALRLVADPQRRRLRAGVDLELALQIYNVYRPECYDEESRLKKCCDEFKKRLCDLNAAAEDELRAHLRAAVDNCVAGIRYERLQEDGPRLAEVSEKHPLVPRYFTWVGVPEPPAGELEAALWGERGERCMAHNGWLMDADPLEDFAAAAAGGRVYLRRELLAWGDSVKLRYGAGPAAAPALWARMRDYVELTAELFDGLRLDNCHSTPLHVAEYMLDCARNVKPELLVVAELFTNSDHVDNIFVNRLGITALIREAQSAGTCREQGRQLHRFGGRGAGSFLAAGPRALRPEVAPALFLDVTHDNPAPLRTRCVFDLLPTAALTAAAVCGSGSTRGYDELVPHAVHVVSETRLYAGAGGPPPPLQEARRVLNELHAALAARGYCELYVDQLDDHVLAVTRHHPRTRQSVIVVAYTAFGAPSPDAAPHRPRALRLEGRLSEILFEMDLKHVDHKNGGSPLRAPGAFSPDAELISGLTEYEASVRRAVPAPASRVLHAVREDGPVTTLEFRPLLPGVVAAFQVEPPAEALGALEELHALQARLLRREPDPLALHAALADLTLADFNTLLYRCDQEERDHGEGGVYSVPGAGPLAYAGLAGAAAALRAARDAADLGAAVCDNLRAGDWLLDYQAARLERAPRLAGVAARVRALLRPVARLPRFLVPAYADLVLGALHAELARAALARMPGLGGPGGAGPMRRALALTSVQLTAACPSAPFVATSLSAGLPHFAVGYMRCWGRDTFISLRGLYLLTGRFQEARAHILGFAACLRHGLIPNLLDDGRRARYNCRDAVWWWLYSIQQYCAAAPEGVALLGATVQRLFPTDDVTEPPAPPRDQPLHELMQEALDKHFQGVVFRERGAGRGIDAHMADAGFGVQLGVDPDTGFPFGGNDHNAGTWMDKMGSSERAGTRGRPATPRDGSAVELVALAHSAALWLAALHRAGRYRAAGLVRRHADGALTTWTFAAWAERIAQHFERVFWVPPAPGAADARPDLVHRRAIYKDTHGATRPWADYQLRCNYVVAMAVSPTLFDPKHAWLALDNVERHLLAPLGLRTLDPADWAFRPNYRNDDDSDDPSVAHGYNYHQGPEWAWPLGFYVRARLAFAPHHGKLPRAVAAGYCALAGTLAELRASPWAGVPELTDAGGAPCPGSCRTQAWSSASALEALGALHEAARARPLLAD